MSTRNPKDMAPRLYDRYLVWDRRMQEAGLRYCLTRVACSYKEQVALYSQGRDSLYIVNHYRWLVGLPPIHDPENRIITWTLKSLHIVDIEDHDPDNDKARAFDFAVTRDGKPIWDKMLLEADRMNSMSGFLSCVSWSKLSASLARA